MTIRENVNLAPLTTFHIGGPAKFFCTVDNLEELSRAVTWAKSHQQPTLILGGGSNVLIHDKGFSGLVIHFAPQGREILVDNDTGVTWKVAAGENWDETVKSSVEQNWWGVENLSHIPGLVGGFVVQNVGAYGQEASNVIKEVEVFDCQEGRVKNLSNKQCRFDYRQSIFNTSEKNRYVIISVTIKLSKKPQPNLSYGDVKRYFDEQAIAQPTQEQIRQAIIAIRNRKFPFPKGAVDGNAGSFFRGPILGAEQIEYLFQKIGTNFGTEALARLHSMADRLLVAQGMKTPSAFLIELCGLKGLQIGGAKVHTEQPAIVLNTTGRATAADVLLLFKKVGQTVYQRTGVILHMEPELVGFSTEEKEIILDSVVPDDIIRANS